MGQDVRTEDILSGQRQPSEETEEAYERRSTGRGERGESRNG
jgi:hypothetical protein